VPADREARVSHPRPNPRLILFPFRQMPDEDRDLRAELHTAKAPEQLQVEGVMTSRVRPGQILAVDSDSHRSFPSGFEPTRSPHNIK
jgi:hypothetical protein